MGGGEGGRGGGGETEDGTIYSILLYIHIPCYICYVIYDMLYIILYSVKLCYVILYYIILYYII